MRDRLASNVWWIALVLAIVLLIAHVLSLPGLNIDSTALALLGIILLSPFASAIRKIKIGDIEAEIAPEEVAELRREITAIQSNFRERDGAETKGTDLLIHKTIDHIRSTAELDPPLALMELRLEIENAINRLARRISPEIEGRNRTEALRRRLDRLLEEGALSASVADSLRRVVSIANRAAHGEKIQSADALSVIDSGTVLLEQIHWHAWDLAEGEIETKPLDPDAVESYREARYELISIRSLVDHPEKNIRIVTQEDLDHILDGYNEYAEFIVGLRKLDSEVGR